MSNVMLLACSIFGLAHLTSTCMAHGLSNQVSPRNDHGFDSFSLCFQSNSEEMTDVPMVFKHPLPSWLQGTLVRNGLGKFENGNRTFVHAFDGFAKLASWKFLGNGTVFFSTRFLQSSFYRESMASYTIAPYTLFQSVNPPFGLLEKIVAIMRGLDNMNVNVYDFAGPKSQRREYAALNDYWMMYNISIATLSTNSRIVPTVEERRDPRSHNLSPLSFLSSAHPLPEFGTTNRFTPLSSFAVFPGDSNRISLLRMQSLRRREIVAQWSVDKMPYMHSFSVTPTKVILLASPFYNNLWCMVRKVEAFPCMDWYQEQPSTLYVVHLRNKTVDAIKIPNVFAMHHVNAYDAPGDKVVMDVSSYPNPYVIGNFQLGVLRDPSKRDKRVGHGKLKRITVDVARKRAAVKDVDDGPPPGIASFLDLPAINELYRSKHYCYAYGLVFKADNVSYSKIAVVKKDLCHAGAGDRVWQSPEHYPMEPWFVGRPQAVEEDDGMLMVPVLRGNQNATFLVILDAKDLHVINEAKVPTNIPFSPHGRFFPA